MNDKVNDDSIALSIILPCYKGASLAARSVEELCTFLPRTGLSWEVIVVDDGGGDFTGHEWTDPRVSLIKLPVNQGKGAAVRAGVLGAKGAVRIFTDVDIPYGPESFLVMAHYIMEKGFHVVIGDRHLPGSSYAAELTQGRQLASSVFSFFIGRFVTGGFFDTQCGLKAFRGDVAAELFRISQVERFAFDVELVYLSLKYKLDIKRIPVRLRANETSSVRLFRDSTNMICDVFAIKWRMMKRKYLSKRLENIVSEDYEKQRCIAASIPVPEAPHHL